MSDFREESPVNPLPPIVVILALAIFAVEVIFLAGARGLVGGPEAVGWRLGAIREYAFLDSVFDWMLANGRWPTEHLKRFVTYAFVHQGFTSAVMALVFILALGKLVGEVFGAIAFLIVFFLSTIVGALAYGWLLNDPVPLIGAFPGAYGLIGSYTFMLWVGTTDKGVAKLRAFSLIAILLGIQLLFGLLFGSNSTWVAEVVGFLTGFLVTFGLVPGAMRAVLARIRQR